MTCHKFGSRRRALSTAALCTVLAVAALLIGTPSPASAAPSTQLLYSTDGGASWVADPTIGPGGSALVRVWYDNDTGSAITGAQVSTTLPAGFTRVPNTTEVCLSPATSNPATPSSSQDVCANADETAVWSGSTLGVSPTAGLFGQSNANTTGIMEMGKVRFLNLHQCGWTNAAQADRLTGLIAQTTGNTFDTGTNASNTADTNVSCASPPAGWTQNDISGVQAVDLVGDRYLNLHQCSYSHSTGDRISSWITSTQGGFFDSGTNASNTLVGGAAVCDTPPGGWSANTFTGRVSLDLLGNRYLNLHQCQAALSSPTDRLTSVSPDTNSGNLETQTNTSNTPDTTNTCVPMPSPWIMTSGGGVQAIDLLDTTRGRGFVEFVIVAPNVTETTEFTMASSVSGNGLGNPPSDSSTITVDVAAVPLVAPIVGGATVLLAGGGWLAVRKLRRRDEGEPVLVA